MNIKLFRQKSLALLINDVKPNLKHYRSNDKWVESYFESKGIGNYCFDSGVLIPDFALVNGDSDTDLENSIHVYEAMRGNIDRLQATDLRMWAYLTHITCWEYMRKRWPIECSDSPENRVQDRYLFDRKPYVRNGIARLYWTALMTYDESNATNPYELTEFAFSKQDIQVFSLERDLGRSKNLMLGNLTALREHDGELKRNDIRFFFEKIDQIGGVELLDSFSKNDSIQLSKKIIDEIAELPCVEENSSVEIKSIKSGKVFPCKVRNKKLTYANVPISVNGNIVGMRIGMKITVNGEPTRIISIH